jgi:MFS transporter, FSR family, fosmidomycin resistance protein
MTAAPLAAAQSPRRTLSVCAGAHALHDGYTDLLGVLLPLVQAQFGLSYTAIGALRMSYSAAMASGQVPSGLLAERFGLRPILVAGTVLAAFGYAVVAWGGASGGIALVAVGIALSGLGSATQHPIGSSLVSAAFAGAQSRTALGTYNFSGDMGKMLLPAAFAAVAATVMWPVALLAVVALGLLGAALLYAALPDAAQVTEPQQADGAAPPRGPYWLLMAIHVIDSATRSGYLTFLPFLLTGKGASLPLLGTALALLFAGGAAGKLACGWLGARIGVLRTVYLTEGLTTLCVVAALFLPLAAVLVLLPLLGLCLNGTSSVLYGTVPELVAPERRTRAFSLFYTGGSLAGVGGPLAYGLLSDAAGVPTMMVVLAGVVLLTLPLAWRLQPAIERARG